MIAKKKNWEKLSAFFKKSFLKRGKGRTERTKTSKRNAEAVDILCDKEVQ